jgi:hypothetical protein
MVDWFQLYMVVVVLYVLVVVSSEWHGDRVQKRAKRLALIHSLITGRVEDI